MALILYARKGDVFYIDDVKLKVEKLIFEPTKTKNPIVKKSFPYSMVLSVFTDKGMEKFLITKECFTSVPGYPDWLLAVGSRHKEDSRSLSLMFEVPKENKIYRKKIYDKIKKQEVENQNGC